MEEIRFGKSIFKYLIVPLLVLIFSLTYIWLGTIIIFNQTGIAKVPNVYIKGSGNYSDISGMSFADMGVALVISLINFREKNFPWMRVIAVLFIVWFSILKLKYVPTELVGESLELFNMLSRLLLAIYTIILSIIIYITFTRDITILTLGGSKFDLAWAVFLLAIPLTCLTIYYVEGFNFPANLINVMFN